MSSWALSTVAPVSEAFWSRQLNLTITASPPFLRDPRTCRGRADSTPASVMDREDHNVTTILLSVESRRGDWASPGRAKSMMIETTCRVCEEVLPYRLRKTRFVVAGSVRRVLNLNPAGV